MNPYQRYSWNCNLPATVKETLHSNWLFGVILDEKINIENVIKRTVSRGIETRPFFHTLNSMPPYMIIEHQ